MAHLNPSGVDFVNAAIIVNHKEPKVLLVYHNKLDGWFPPGGHIELNEDTDEALAREVFEETGLIVGNNVGFYSRGQAQSFVGQSLDWRRFNPDTNNHSKVLHAPMWVDIHNFSPLPGHRHIGLVYLLMSTTDEVKLAAEEHRAIRWFTADELAEPTHKIIDTVKWYCKIGMGIVHGTDFS